MAKWVPRVLKGVRTYYTYSHEPFHPLKRQPAWRTAEEAVSVIKSGDVVFVHGAAATPLRLVEAMTQHGKAGGLKGVSVCHIHTEGQAPYTEPDCEGIFRSNSFFIGSNCRLAINEGRADYVPIFLSEIPLLFHRNIINIDVALVQVNPCMPRTFGDGVIHKSHFDAMVDGLASLPEHVPKPRSEVENEIGRLIADELVDNGATLQMGIGNIPDAVLDSLKGHRDLGIHSEMFSDGVVELVEAGCVTNTHKAFHPGKIVGSFLVGTRRLFDFVDNNPFVVMCDVSFVNNIPVIAKNPRVTAINSCIEVDLTGQVVSDSIGTKMYSGVGGQVDFLRGAAVGRDGLGKPILAMPSTTSRGESKIVPFLKQGGGVVTTRAHLHYLVTEYGIAYLFGKNLRQRAHHLIRIAHPDHREALEKAAYERLHCMPSPDL
ncbi:4-hydroxybutyrate coenzyme A transferase [Chionoecetes opilio]|uniref:4-hydroxybutyrate coenzyme A transferase n=1 Tax=Chionoecetes opilio TaxID=41210 RepID=A0A8J5C2J2_CHIOP|nr:4-hydroxybutyrate coenzyme A transferase [Chionoecetes opilio]